MRLPFDVRTGGNVAVPRPVKPGVLAHRLTYYKPAPVPDQKARRAVPGSMTVAKPGCVSDADAREVGTTFAEMSAGWADKQGAEACLTCW